MINKKKTFYEILAVPPNATYQEIQATYESLVLALKSQKKVFTPEEYDFKLKIIDLAFKTLSTPESRNAYDAELAARKATGAGSASPNAIALLPDPDAMLLKAEAISLRAEAISLRVDALTMKSDVAAFNGLGNHQAFGQMASSSLMPMLKKSAMFLGFLLAGWMVVQVLFLLIFNRSSHQNADMASQASEKVIIQEYYQTHGVRAGSKAEVELLQAQERRQESESRRIERENFKAEREKQKAEDDYRRFEQEARQRADQVSAELRYAENKALEQAERKEAEIKRQQDEEKRNSEQAERDRIEREREKWRETLNR